ncbi:stage V sporulation protein B [Salimicrobium halophilum]|uniref:Stage V sporulation protein B n=1 Tax=Salimicrobium halophilum TaxID=86666 RepID=A0A1G8PL75_9BACI|nr:stage V sporulation protein B [Salimicrobium halophilum]SDI93207.1 stage V sporulation protein B [Salimicrobium halophilum]
MSKQTFLKGALLLIIAGLITRIFGFVNRIVTARILGEEGVGIYMMALPTLVLVFTITQVGLPIAIAKRISELETSGKEELIKPTLVFSLWVTGVMSIVTGVGLWFISPFIADVLLQDGRVTMVLRAIIPAIPVIAVSSVIKGYFQGRQNMKPQAYTQVLEQVVRIGFIFIFTPPLLAYGLVTAAAGVMIGAVIGEIVSLVCMIYYFRKDYNPAVADEKTQSIARPLLNIALPASGNRAIGSSTYFLEPIVVAQGLTLFGYTTIEVSQLYGQLTGFILPLLMMPAFFTHGLSTALIPALSEAHASGDRGLVNHRVQQAIRLSLLSGGFATILLLIHPTSILSLLYNTTSGDEMLKLMAPFFLLHYMQSPLQAALQALDFAKEAMMNSLFGNLLKYSILLLLTTSIGFSGVVIAMVLGVVLVTGLHMLTMYRHRYHIMTGKQAGAFLVLLSLSFAVGYVTTNALPGSPIALFLSIATVSLIYIPLSVMLGLVKKDEWRLFVKK